MATHEKTTLRNRLWRRFSKSATARGIRSLAASFREIFAELSCRSAAPEPQTRLPSPAPAASAREAPLAATSGRIPVPTQDTPDVDGDTDVPKGKEVPDRPIHTAIVRPVGVVAPVTAEARKPRRPLYRPTPLTTSDVGMKKDTGVFRAAFNDPRVVFVERKYNNDNRGAKTKNAVTVHVNPLHADIADTTADSAADIDIDAVISELDTVINSRPNTVAERTEMTAEIDVDEIISELDDILTGGESSTKSSEDGRAVATKAGQAKEATYADIDEMIDEEYNYYGM